MERIYRKTYRKMEAIRHGKSFTSVTGYFKLKAMAKRQMRRQAAKMLQSHLQSQGTHPLF